MSIHMDDLTNQQIKDAREWIADCSWSDLAPKEIKRLTADEVYDGVQRHYGGGWKQFLRDGNY